MIPSGTYARVCFFEKECGGQRRKPIAKNEATRIIPGFTDSAAVKTKADPGAVSNFYAAKPYLSVDFSCTHSILVLSGKIMNGTGK